jgi:hypothetical protein
MSLAILEIEGTDFSNRSQTAVQDMGGMHNPFGMVLLGLRDRRNFIVLSSAS